MRDHITILMRLLSALRNLAMALCLIPTAAGATGTLLVVASAKGNAHLVAWQDHIGGWHAGGALPAPNGAPAFYNLTLCPGNNSTTQLVGLDSAGNVWLVSWEDSGGGWHSGFKLPGFGVSFASIAMGQGANNLVQVIGLDAKGYAYLADWQDAQGNWHAGSTIINEGASGRLNSQAGFSSVTVSQGPNNTFNVAGVCNDAPGLICIQSPEFGTTRPDGTFKPGEHVNSCSPTPCVRYITVTQPGTTGHGLPPDLILGLTLSPTEGLPMQYVYETTSGTWVSDVLTLSTGALPPLAAIAATATPNNMRWVVGLASASAPSGDQGRPYLIAYQSPSLANPDGIWTRVGTILPCPNTTYATIALAVGSNNNPQVIGQDTAGNPYLMSHQLNGIWVSGMKLGSALDKGSLVVGNAGNTANPKDP